MTVGPSRQIQWAAPLPRMENPSKHWNLAALSIPTPNRSSFYRCRFRSIAAATRFRPNTRPSVRTRNQYPGGCLRRIDASAMHHRGKDTAGLAYATAARMMHADNEPKSWWRCFYPICRTPSFAQRLHGQRRKYVPKRSVGDRVPAVRCMTT